MTEAEHDDARNYAAEGGHDGCDYGQHSHCYRGMDPLQFDWGTSTRMRSMLLSLDCTPSVTEFLLTIFGKAKAKSK